MKLRYLVVVCCFVLVVSVAMNIILGLYAIRFYRQLHRILLDPVNAGTFGDQGIILNTDGKPLVVFVGDSRISRWLPLPSLAGCRIVNRGVSGETTGQTLLRLEKDVISLKPSLAVIQVGINDIKTIGVFPKQRQSIIDSCGDNIRTIVEHLTAKSISVIIMTIVPPGKPGFLRRLVWSDAIYPAVGDINDLIKTMRNDKVVILDCDTFMSEDEKIKPQYACDTLHFSLCGYEELNRHIEPVLIEFMGSLKN